MKGSVSLDFLLSLVVLLLVSSALFSMAYLHAEEASAFEVKYKAESMAMELGSVINHFAAINPESGSMKISINSPGFYSSQLNDFGLSGILIDFVSCGYTITKNNVTVNITYARVESNILESRTATYPIVSLTSSTLQNSCDDELTLTKTAGGFEVA